VLVIPREAEGDVIAKAVEKARTEGEVEKAIKSGMGACEAWEKFGVF
jgi:regulator of RNase E activity RraA